MQHYPEQGQHVTIRRLLNHTSGIKGYTEIPAFWDRFAARVLPRDSLLALFDREPFDFAPGEAMIYNNSAHFLLGLIIEKASGESYPDYVQHHLFDPAGMRHSRYCPDFTLMPGRVQGYEMGDSGLQRAYERIPGVSAAVVHDQELVWTGASGYADLARHAPATPSTVYSICSISKLFTSIALMRQRDARKVRLDAPVSQYLPWFNIRQTYAASPPITVEGLLTHASGPPREADYAYWTGEFRFPSHEQVVAGLAKEQTLYPAEQYFQYSNLGLTLAGEIVAAVSGEPYGEYATRHVLQPLGLTSTTPEAPEGWEVTYGLGFSVWHDGKTTFVGQGGSCPGYRTRIQLEPHGKIATVFMSNAGDANANLFARRMYDIVAPALRTVLADSTHRIPPQDTSLVKYAGSYDQGPWSGEAIVIPWEDGLAMVDLPTDDPMRSLTKLKRVPGEPNTFRRVRDDDSHGEPIVVDLGPDGRAVRYWRFHNPYPQWSHAGRELFYRNAAGNLVAVAVSEAPTFAPGRHTVLFDASTYLATHEGHAYAVLPGGDRLLMLRPVSRQQTASAAHLVLGRHWLADVERKAAGQ